MNVLAGIPVLMPPGMPPWKPYRGSIQVPCEACGQAVWQGPSQQLLKAENPDLPVICVVCCITKYGMTADDKIILLTDKQTGD